MHCTVVHIYGNFSGAIVSQASHNCSSWVDLIAEKNCLPSVIFKTAGNTFLQHMFINHWVGKLNVLNVLGTPFAKQNWVEALVKFKVFPSDIWCSIISRLHNVHQFSCFAKVALFAQLTRCVPLQSLPFAPLQNNPSNWNHGQPSIHLLLRDWWHDSIFALLVKVNVRRALVQIAELLQISSVELQIKTETLPQSTGRETWCENADAVQRLILALSTTLLTQQCPARIWWPLKPKWKGTISLKFLQCNLRKPCWGPNWQSHPPDAEVWNMLPAEPTATKCIVICRRLPLHDSVVFAATSLLIFETWQLDQLVALLLMQKLLLFCASLPWQCSLSCWPASWF